MPTSIHTNITINGKKYDSLDQANEDFPNQFQDKDGNGIPDQFDAMIEQAKQTGKISAQFPADFDATYVQSEETDKEAVTTSPNERLTHPNPIIVSDTINRKALIIMFLILASVISVILLIQK